MTILGFKQVKVKVSTIVKIKIISVFNELRLVWLNQKRWLGSLQESSWLTENQGVDTHSFEVVEGYSVLWKSAVSFKLLVPKVSALSPASASQSLLTNRYPSSFFLSWAPAASKQSSILRSVITVKWTHARRLSSGSLPLMVWQKIEREQCLLSVFSLQHRWWRFPMPYMHPLACLCLMADTCARPVRVLDA